MSSTTSIPFNLTTIQRLRPLLLILLLILLQSTLLQCHINPPPSSAPTTVTPSTRALSTLLLDDSNILLSSHPTTNTINPRNLIAMPLSESFDPPMGHFSKGKLMDGDKVCLPGSYWKSIRNHNVEVPWCVKIRRLSSPPDLYTSGGQTLSTSSRVKSPLKPREPRDVVGDREEVLASPLDFRSDEKHVWLPGWMFRSMGLRPGDVVRVELMDPQPKMGGLVKLRPLTFTSPNSLGDDATPTGSGASFLKISNHQAVLETELKHYSTITPGTTISFVYNGERYYFEVVETWTGGGTGKGGNRKSKEGVRAMDADIRVEFTRVKTM